MLPFFVYGTLKPGGSNYSRYLAGRTSAEQPASLAGAALFDYGPYPFLTEAPDLVDASDQVNGVLITLETACYHVALLELDGLEDYDAASHSGMYLRVVRQVQTAAGPVHAWVYIAGPAMLAAMRAGELPRIASGVWEV
ncbi:MAG: gamma-glutamylcyclotransferase [Chloroflexaceae bacterium]|jgi:gamma-glutamylcyclotransferase (GGCT)/AIG2-like uncharacterized protein YtfP|nr:gamma-glutamylcyclotransferase [Chloroflexaceae bacterium]